MLKVLRCPILAIFIVLVVLNTATAKTIRLKSPSTGTRVHLRVGDELQITVMEIPSTGYRWDVEDHDLSTLKYKGREGRMPRKHRIGAGYLLKFRFRAVAPGRGDIILVQAGRGEADRVTLAIDVAER